MWKISPYVHIIVVYFPYVNTNFIKWEIFMNESLKERVIALAKSRNVSIRRLEQDIGIADKSIAKWDVNKPSIDKVEKIAKYFDVSVDYLLGNDVVIDDELLELRDRIRKNPDTKALLDATAHCSSEQIENIVRMIELWKK